MSELDSPPSHPTSRLPSGSWDTTSQADAVFLELQTRQGREDPYSRYTRLRELAPVHVSRYGVTVLTRYEDCARALRSPDLQVEDAAWMDLNEPDWRRSPTNVVMGESLLHRNPPDHTRLRKLVSGSFTPRRVRELVPRIEALVAAELDMMADAGSDGGPVDVHDLMAFPLPVSVIGALLGVPESDWSWLRGPTAAISVVFDLFAFEEAYERSDRAIRELAPYLTDLIEQRRKSPQDDMISALISVRDRDGGLTEDELLQTVMLLFIAGFETTVNLITNGVMALLRHPEQRAALLADPTLAEAAVEEVLRYDAPVQGTMRHAIRDTRIGGVPVPEGSRVVAFLGAANRDPGQFTHPDRFDIRREGPKATSFGGGIHYCLGASLARLEAAIALPALITRFPRLALHGEAELRPIFNLRGYSRLPVTLG